ncbi:MAG: NADPH-dependent glutamate synthase [Coriobacteriales bacterium]|jgi:glutamate synthase (NADPH/NADH) small chain
MSLDEKKERYIPRPKDPRVPANEEDPAERIKDFRPVDNGYTEEMALAEANRCLNCPKPKCIDGCPAGIDIPGFIAAIRDKDYGRGLDIIRADSLLPAICGRVCPQESQCEKLCVVGVKNEPVAIGQLERFLGDMPEVGTELPAAAPNGKKVAVIGAGPSGITCAAELARYGFDVTVIEAFFTGGGVLVYGIPEFRLPKDVVRRELDVLADLGVKFEYNSVAGRVTNAEELFDEGYDAIYIATGAGAPKLMNIPGENLPNVFFANEFLTRVNLMKANRFPEYDTPTKHAKNVVVFGGGNVAMDAVRTALRLGAESATIVYRRTRNEMPARAAEIEHAEAEGIKFIELAGPLQFIAGEDGKVAAVEVQHMELGEPDESGRRRPVPIEGDTEIIECDLAISAIGTNANKISPLIGGVELDKRGYIIADEKTGRTSNPRIWAGGDIVTGAATVILAMGAGKDAARDIAKSLLGEDAVK